MHTLAPRAVRLRVPDIRELARALSHASSPSLSSVAASQTHARAQPCACPSPSIKLGGERVHYAPRVDLFGSQDVLVGALDDSMMVACAQQGLPCVRIEGGE
eukprot:2088883-Pleurochrysis_carterae.AAC.1